MIKRLLLALVLIGVCNAEDPRNDFSRQHDWIHELLPHCQMVEWEESIYDNDDPLGNVYHSCIFWNSGNNSILALLGVTSVRTEDGLPDVDGFLEDRKENLPENCDVKILERTENNLLMIERNSTVPDEVLFNTFCLSKIIFEPNWTHDIFVLYIDLGADDIETYETDELPRLIEAMQMIQ